VHDPYENYGVSGGGRKVAIAIPSVNECAAAGHKLPDCLVLIVASKGAEVIVRVMLLILGTFHALNGLRMILAPAAWYASIPGVPETGPFNPHFVTDIGLIFLASGAGLILGASKRPWAGSAAIAGATWPVLHALFHIWSWLSMGFPRTAPTILSEVVGVVAVGFLGALLAWMRAQQEGVA
jgi:hypothetical protein